jgi:hypothetical protein
MTTNNVSKYDSIKVGDTISLPKSFSLVKSGKIVSVRKWNQHAKRVTCDNGAWFELSRYSNDYLINP